MSRSRDPLALTPHWHLDCRLEAELPEDNLVSNRFLVDALFGSVTLMLTLLTGWLTYKNVSLRYEIHDWEQRIADNRGEIRDIQRMQSEYRHGGEQDRLCLCAHQNAVPDLGIHRESRANHPRANGHRYDRMERQRHPRPGQSARIIGTRQPPCSGIMWSCCEPILRSAQISAPSP